MLILAQQSEGGETQHPAQAPTQPTEKACMRCGASFACYARCTDAERKCWCSQIAVPPEVLARLREQYQDCLCETCFRTAK